MGLTDYFEATWGTGISATADSEGNLNLAIYAHPHMEDDEEGEAVSGSIAAYFKVSKTGPLAGD